MSKITIEREEDRTVITNRLAYPEAVNERVFNAISSGMFENFLPIVVRKKRKESIIECTVQGLIPLDVYFSGVVSKKPFLDVVSRIVQIIKSCEKNMVNANNLDLQPEYIYIDPQNKTVHCIFWPIVNNQREAPPSAFLKRLPNRLVFNEYEGKDYIETYTNFFKGIDPFSINNFERMIDKLNGKSTSGSTETQSRLITMSDSSYKKKESRLSRNIEYDPFSNGNGKAAASEYILCTECGTQNRTGSNFCRMCGRQLKSIQPDVRPDEPTHPYLIRERTGEKIYIDKPSFRIGKEEGCCDYLVRDNNAISRRHADIITKGNRYFIIDRHSTNRTYIDGRVIPIEKEVEIFSRTSLQLANEDFTFYVE